MRTATDTTTRATGKIGLPPAAWVAAFATTLASCGGGDGDAPAPPPAAKALACDDTMKTEFKPDANTTVTLVKAFKAGDPIALSGTPASPAPRTSPHGLCLVKLNIGPGNPGPASAPSTSAGIGVEVWLPDPAVWSKRLELNGSGGFAGGPEMSSLTVIGSTASLALAISDVAVSAETDHGHITSNVDGSFAMKPDGTINTTLWKDFADRGVHEMADKVKALANAYYLSAPSYSYFLGCSGGGRDGYALAQRYPQDFDGILIGAPGIHWTRFAVSDTYPQLVQQRDLGGTRLTAAQRNSVSAAAVSACDTNLNGQHDGFISDFQQCRYDPTADASVLCTADGGTNATASCVTQVQARAINKMWYGPTEDGSVPNPRDDIGDGVQPGSKQLWYGFSRGTELGWTGGGPTDPIFNGPFPLALDTLALMLQSPSITVPGVAFAPTPRPAFFNATGIGTDGWRNLSYSGLGSAYAQGLALQSAFGNINTESPDLGAYRDRGGKILTYHGMNDPLLPVAQMAHYYTESANATGGFVETQKFHRLFLVPGMAHCAGPALNGIAGVSPPAATSTPLPSATQLFGVLRNWVENKTAPDAIPVSTAASANNRLLCPYPKKITYGGGNTQQASSYICR